MPVPVLRPPLDYCVPTNITIEPNKTRVVLMPDAGGVGKALAALLSKRGAEVLTIDGAPTVEALEDQLAKWTEEGPITGVYWLPALDPEGPLSRLNASARTDALHKRVKLLAATMRALPDTPFLVSATRLGGTARLRLRWRSERVRWRCYRLHEGTGPRAERRAHQGGRFR